MPTQEEEDRRWLAERRHRREGDRGPAPSHLSLPAAIRCAAEAAARLALSWDRVFDVLPVDGSMIPLTEIARALGVNLGRSNELTALLHGLHQPRIWRGLATLPDGRRAIGFARRRDR